MMSANTPEHLMATCERCQSRVSLEPFIADLRRMIASYNEEDSFTAEELAEGCNFGQERLSLQRVLIALLQGDLEAVCEAIYQVDDFANVFSDAKCDLPVFLGITG